MSKVFGIALIVLCLWVGSEIFTKGTQEAFGGALVSLGLVGGTHDGEAAQPVTKRSGDKVRAAHAESDARRERLLTE